MILARVKWANVGKLVAVLGLVAVVAAWPRLREAPPAVPAGTEVPVAPGAPAGLLTIPVPRRAPAPSRSRRPAKRRRVRARPVVRRRVSRRLRSRAGLEKRSIRREIEPTRPSHTSAPPPPVPAAAIRAAEFGVDE